MKRLWLLLLVLLSGTSGFAQTSIAHWARELSKADFKAVCQAKDSLLNYQQAAIPALITLLRDTTFVKLQHTADLIYPGAHEFYGHGWLVDYDIDWVAVRAAWVLEELTFQDFGYRDRAITETKLLAMQQQGYQFYLANGFHVVDFRTKTPREVLMLYRLGLAEKVATWWQKQSPTWTRYGALKEALASATEPRQAVAIHYLRFDKTPCTGLTSAAYDLELRPLLTRIKDGAGSEALQATYLLADEAQYWLTSKGIKSRH